MSFNASERLRAEDDHGQRPCARGDWCSARTVTYIDGKPRTEPARSYQSFCHADRGDILDKLTQLPGKYADLTDAIGEDAQGDGRRSGKMVAPPLPLRGDIDALMRQIVAVLASWHARIADLAQLTPVDIETARLGGYETVRRAVDVIAGRNPDADVHQTRIDMLLGLQPAPMLRLVSIAPRRDDDTTIPVLAAPIQDRFPGADVVRYGLDWVEIGTRLDGTHAGLEILHLQYRCRSLLGETRPQMERLVGVACYECGLKALRRAQPPGDDRSIAFYSRCDACRHKMTEPEYRIHAERLAATVGGPKRVTLELWSPLRPAETPCSMFTAL